MSRRFLDLDEKPSGPETAKFVILPVPFEGTATFLKGTAAAPDAIIEASAHVELFDETLLTEFHRAGICTAEAVGCDNLTAEQLQQAVYEKALPLVRAGKFVLALGGEHSITPALVKAVAEEYPGLSVLQIDAHADLRDEYEGSRYNHACVMRRILDMNVPTVSVGVRSFDAEQYRFMVDRGLKVFSPAEMSADAKCAEEIVAGLSERVYITLDIDALDPGQVPGTGTPEPGGLGYRQVADLIFAAGRSRQIVGADVVEVIPRVAGVVSEFTAARLACKIIAAAQIKE